MTLWIKNGIYITRTEMPLFYFTKLVKFSIIIKQSAHKKILYNNNLLDVKPTYTVCES